jgi:hypothetical protein
MITDRLTARVFGLLLVVLPFMVDVCFLMFSRPELRAQPSFLGILVGMSLPPIALGAWLLRKASRMPDDTEES